MNPPPDRPMDRPKSKVACEACKKSKTRCNKSQPCAKCTNRHIECVYIEIIKLPPVKREHFDTVLRKVERLEGEKRGLQGEVKALKALISTIATASPSQRDALLANFVNSSGSNPRPRQHSAPDLVDGGRSFSIPHRVRDPPSRRIVGPENSISSPSSMEPSYFGSHDSLDNMAPQQLFATAQQNSSFSPWSLLCQGLMKVFFDKQYQYHMSLYREFFLRDFDVGAGPYYSDLLMFAICSIGALASDDGASREISDVFFSQAQQILYSSALEQPSLTTVQALLLLGHREIGLGNMSKGWMLSRMAFSLALDMGLHLDPNNWESPDLEDQEEATSRRRDKEILRRTYWAAFIADKQLSLYFGRPPALYPSQANVHDTTRITYPEGWRILLNKHIKPGIEETAYEDGRNLVAFWIQQIELSKISHRMIVDVFENRNADVGEDVLVASVEEIHLELLNWQHKLVDDLRWSQSSKQSEVPRLVLYLHSLYHTTMIILHRPSRRVFQDASIATSEDIKICYDSLDEIVVLLRTHSLYHPFKHLPFNFVYILATAASIILMRRHLEELSWQDEIIQRPLNVIENALNNISRVWSCANQVIAVIQAAKARPTGAETQVGATYDFGDMTGVETDYNMFNNTTVYCSNDTSSIDDHSHEAIMYEDLDFDWSDPEWCYGATAAEGVDLEPFGVGGCVVIQDKDHCYRD